MTSPNHDTVLHSTYNIHSTVLTTVLYVLTIHIAQRRRGGKGGCANATTRRGCPRPANPLRASLPFTTTVSRGDIAFQSVGIPLGVLQKGKADHCKALGVHACNCDASREGEGARRKGAGPESTDDVKLCDGAVIANHHRPARVQQTRHHSGTLSSEMDAARDGT